MSNQTAITNPRRRKQMEEFWDKNHTVMSEYYDLLEKKIPKIKLLEAMKRLIEKDPDFYDSYILAADIVASERKEKVAKELLYVAYERALKRIADKEGNFPKRIEWGWLENRHLVRIIARWADELWNEGKNNEALEIYRKLLKSNHRDNIGARQNILAIRMGLGPDYEEQFALKETPEYLDGFKLSSWFRDNCKKFPDEFEWWLKAVEKEK